MCKFASFVLTKDKVLWVPDNDSHEEIISKHNLHADGARGTNILRVEITPSDTQTEFTDYASWVYRIDQDTRPSWFDAEYDEKRVREELIVRAKIGFKVIGARVDDITPAWLCPYLKKHRGTFGGNLEVGGSAKLDALALTKVGGNLVVWGSAKLDALALTKVGGNLVVWGSAKLDALALTKVGGNLWGSAKLDALAQVGGNLLVGGSAKLDALALTKVGGNLAVWGSAKLDALALTKVGGNLAVWGSAKLDALALTKVGGNLAVWGSAKLDALAQVGGNLSRGSAKFDPLALYQGRRNLEVGPARSSQALRLPRSAGTSQSGQRKLDAPLLNLNS